MLIKYRFQVNCHIRILQNIPITVGKFRYEIELGEDNQITYIVAIAAIADKSMWSTVHPSTEPGIKIDINIKSPFYDEIRSELKIIEGVLSLFGMESINFDNPQIEWFPESPDEKAELFGFSIKREKPSITMFPIVDFSIIYTAFINSGKVRKSETALCFFRRGKIDLSSKNYIESVVEFLFMIETLFAEGNFKKNQVKKLYQSSEMLQKNIIKTLSNQTLHEMVAEDVRIKAQFEHFYLSKTPDQVISRIINLRGFLHHHSSKTNDIWHPDEHFRFSSDALFLQSLCCFIAFDLIGEHLFK